ncbi:MAG TPA: hypothetical protein DEP66_05915 [Acidimicrobiaceae bacterium]|nr:hypothetical protein [Acidimicrobiaceae bacterium]HCB37727.1 hypothetical protein [Acidimicrobiaceae bacterium]
MPFPVTLSVETPPRIRRRRTVLMVILLPLHLAVLTVLAVVGAVMLAVSWLTIVVSGRHPDGLIRFWVGLIRYAARFNTHMLVLNTRYPPLRFDSSDDDPGGYTTRIDFEPHRGRRSRLGVLVRPVPALPLLVFLVAVWSARNWILFAVALPTLIVAGRWPDGLREVVVEMQAAEVRIGAYFVMLVDRYPPFDLTGLAGR